MGGDGKIGGGGSCWVNFVIEDGKSMKRLHAFDIGAREGCVATVKFPKGCTPAGRNTFKVNLDAGTCIHIKWGKLR